MVEEILVLHLGFCGMPTDSRRVPLLPEAGHWWLPCLADVRFPAYNLPGHWLCSPAGLGWCFVRVTQHYLRKLKFGVPWSRVDHSGCISVNWQCRPPLCISVGWKVIAQWKQSPDRISAGPVDGVKSR